MTAVLDLVEQVQASEALAQLPEFLKEQLTLPQVQALEEEAVELEAGLKGGTLPPAQVAVYRERRKTVTTRLAGLKRVVSAISQGYEPYTMPEDWYAGLAMRPSRVQRFFDGWLGRPQTLKHYFASPIPAEALVSMQQAQKTGLFGKFLIGSPESEAFHRIMPIRIDPVLVGYVALTDDMKFTRLYPGLEVDNAVGFRIATWGMQEDRKAAGMDF